MDFTPAAAPPGSQQSRRRAGSVSSLPHGGIYQKQSNLLYKTEMCRSWKESGTCRYGCKCQFAHGEHELQEVQRHPRYKTELCRTFAMGYCPYGHRCRFIHATPASMQGTPPPGPPRAPAAPFSGTPPPPVVPFCVSVSPRTTVSRLEPLRKDLFSVFSTPAMRDAAVASPLRASGTPPSVLSDMSNVKAPSLVNTLPPPKLGLAGTCAMAPAAPPKLRPSGATSLPALPDDLFESFQENCAPPQFSSVPERGAPAALAPPLAPPAQSPPTSIWAHSTTPTLPLRHAASPPSSQAANVERLACLLDQTLSSSPKRGGAQPQLWSASSSWAMKSNASSPYSSQNFSWDPLTSGGPAGPALFQAAADGGTAPPSGRRLPTLERLSSS